MPPHSPSVPMQRQPSKQLASQGVKLTGQISRRALFLILAGGAAAAATTVGAIVYVNNAVSTPEKTLSTYVDAIKNRDAQTAYNQLSSRLQSQEDEQQFASAVSLIGIFIGNYTISNVQVNGSTATATVDFSIAGLVTASYTAQLVKENNVWKIDGGTLISIN